MNRIIVETEKSVCFTGGMMTMSCVESSMNCFEGARDLIKDIDLSKSGLTEETHLGCIAQAPLVGLAVKELCEDTYFGLSCEGAPDRRVKSFLEFRDRYVTEKGLQAPPIPSGEERLLGNKVFWCPTAIAAADETVALIGLSYFLEIMPFYPLMDICHRGKVFDLEEKEKMNALYVYKREEKKNIWRIFLEGYDNYAYIEIDCINNLQIKAMRVMLEKFGKRQGGYKIEIRE